MIRKTTLILLSASLLVAQCTSDRGMNENDQIITDLTETETMKSDDAFKGRSIAFYNVENLFDTENNPVKKDDDFTPDGHKEWTEDRYQTKLGRIEDAISLIGDDNPMLLGLAEVENRDVLEDLIQEGKFAQTNYEIVHFDSPDKRGIDCALLYDSDAFSVINSENIRVKIPFERRFKTRDILYVQGETGGNELHVFVNHWSSRREGKYSTEHRRMEAASILRERVDEILEADENANILIMGDFNDHPDDKSLEFVLRAKESGYEDEGDLINLLYDEHMDGEGTSVFEQDWAVLDQIIVSQSLYDQNAGIGILKQDAEIVRDRSLLFTYHDGGQKPSASYGGTKYYGGFSDHLPIYVILK